MALSRTPWPANASTGWAGLAVTAAGTTTSPPAPSPPRRDVWPSTCALIVGVLRERGSAVPYRRRFVPNERGRAVTAFLETWFARYAADGSTTQRGEQRQSERQDYQRRGEEA